MVLTRRKIGIGMAAAAFGSARTSVQAAEPPKFEFAMAIGTEGSGEGQFKYVEDFAFTKEGHLLATDALHAWVQVFDTKTGKFLARFGGKGDDDQHLDKPEGIAVDPSGNIFVADYNTGYVKRYDSAYRWNLTFSEYGSAPGQNQKSEFMDIRDGRLYMPEAGNHRVNIFDLNGKYLSSFGGFGTEPGQMNNPECARFTSDGKLYVTDLKNDRIQVFDKDGKHLSGWGSTGSEPGQFRSPAGLAVDAEDRIYISEIGNDRVQVFDKDGKFLTMWGKKGKGHGEFGNMHGIAVEKRTGLVFVADTANNRIQVFRPVPARTGS